MKVTLIFLLVFIGSTNFVLSDGGCLPTGDTTNPKLEALNLLKNRPVSTPDNINSEVTLGEMYNSGDVADKFNQHDAATVQGYLFNAKQEKGESCNCHTDDVDKQDIHIYISPNAHASSIADCVVVEMSANGKAAHPEWTAAYIKKMKGHKVSVTGYLLYDFEHTSQSYDTNPDGGTIYRHTVWEIHPITDIHIIQ